MAWKLRCVFGRCPGGWEVMFVRMNPDYMRRFILERVEELEDYEVMFEIFVICLRHGGKTYGQYRVEVLRGRELQMDFVFWN